MEEIKLGLLILDHWQLVYQFQKENLDLEEIYSLKNGLEVDSLAIWFPCILSFVEF